MSSKKRLSWELVIFGITFVAAGFFVYLQQQNISITEVWDRVMQQIKPVDTQRMEVVKEKGVAEQNYKNFIRNNSLDDLTNSQQYKELQGTPININITDGVGNPDPFNQPKVENQQ